MVRNHYLLLGIPPDAGQRQIKSVYRTLAKRFHPDRNKGSEAAADLFRQINDAYKVLSDPKQRAAYDKKLQLQQREEQKSKHRATSTHQDPQQKFSKFLGSLLDAIFGPAPSAAKQQSSRTRTSRQVKKPTKRPDFNFYYHLASEKKGAAYNRGADGIYRRENKRRKPFKPDSGSRPYRWP